MQLYKIWDNDNKVWVTENISITPNGDVIIFNHRGKKKVKFKIYDSSSFTVYKNTYAEDKFGFSVFEGDIVETDFGVTGVVVYSPERLEYFIMDYENRKYYLLSDERCKQLILIGNVCEDESLNIKWGKGEING